ncbi:uncharacterized protein LOC104907321 [Beta vulgaris subsp. vulgaris]|uniref:uncharacterized protein LOC104907321 n=1 Tax=Beta vulgaris subsp. vulgaris TaxID=3555 RepID=UPI00053FEE7D|nr:uncharacterized protein LOC104907321 [Beta vulgaris subsp. vulgaris]
MDVKNVFLHGELQENVYMKMPPGYKGLGHGFEVESEGEYVKHTSNSKKKQIIIVILVYVDDLIIASNDMSVVKSTKALLSSHFQMKDLGIIRYFLGIKVDHCKDASCINLQVPHMQAAKRVLRYLAGSMSQGILLANTSAAHLQALCDSDWARCADTRKSTLEFCILLGDSQCHGSKKRRFVVARSSAEAEYRSMALTICEMM